MSKSVLASPSGTGGAVFQVFTLPHTAFAAGILVEQLQKLGHTAQLTNFINRNDDCIYIIYGAHTLKYLPARFIIYQTEVSTSHHFHPFYLQALSKAIAVWDYSLINTYRYNTRNKKISIVSPGIKNISPPVLGGVPEGGGGKAVGNSKRHGILFYGWLQGSPRRQQLIAEIQAQIPLQIITNITGPEMHRQLLKAHTVLNLHYYENSPLETFRIHEALSHGCHVVSESSPLNETIYKKCVHSGTGADWLLEQLQNLRDKPFNYDLKPLDNLEQVRSAINASL